MGKRWLILALLFLVRTVTGIQYQSVASVSPFLMEDLGVNFAQLGLLIGLYQLPGILLAIPSGLLGKRFDDKLVVSAALGLMAVGGLAMGLGGSYGLLFVGRLLSGAGVILLNVLLTKMVADWFVGREIVTAMAILMSSWPFGISIGLVTLGPLALANSWPLVMQVTAALCLVGLVLVAVFYRPPPAAEEASGEEAATSFKLSLPELWLVLLAGLIWGLFNAAFASLPSFAPAFLTSTGYSLAQAGNLVSIVTWVVIPSVQLGGYLAERLSRPNYTVAACFLGTGLAMWLLPMAGSPALWLIILGVIFGPPAGIIVALPAEVLKPENRALGMGVFFTCYYAVMPILTALAGLAADLTQSTAAPLQFGGTLLLAALLVLFCFRLLQRRRPMVLAL